MSIIIQTEAKADAHGGVRLDLPPETVQPNAQILLKVQIDQKAGEQFSRRFATKEEYNLALGRIVGQTSDLTFVPPKDQPLQDIDPL